MKKRIVAMLLTVLLFASPILDADIYPASGGTFASAEDVSEADASGKEEPQVQDAEKAAEASEDETEKDPVESEEAPEESAPTEADEASGVEDNTSEDAPEGDNADAPTEGEDSEDAPVDDSQPEESAAWEGYAEIASGATIRLSGGETAKVLEGGIVIVEGVKDGVATITFACRVPDKIETQTGRVSERCIEPKPEYRAQSGDIKVGEYWLKAIGIETGTENKETSAQPVKLVRLPDGTVVAFDDLTDADREELAAVFGIGSDGGMSDEELRAAIYAQYGVKVDGEDADDPQVRTPDGSSVSLSALLKMDREALLAFFGDAAEEFSGMSAAQLAAFILSMQTVDTRAIDDSGDDREKKDPVVPKPQPVDGIKYTQEWWDARTADARKPVKATVTYDIPLTEAKAAGQYTEPDYIIVDGYVYKVIEGPTPEETTYETVYDPDRVTYENTFDPAAYDGDSYDVEVVGQPGGAFPDGAKIVGVAWDTVPGYELRESGDTVTLVKLKDVEIGKNWLDGGLSDGESFRPTVDEWLGYLNNTLYGNDGSEIGLEHRMVLQDGDDWKLIVTGVPAFASADIPIVYHVEENFDPGITYPSDMKNRRGYETKQYNPGADQQGGTDHEIYEDGYSESVLKGIVPFTFDKVWLDGDENVDNRPAVTFYLYRYVEGSEESNINNASPVRGHDSKHYPEGAEEFRKQYRTENPSHIEYADDLDEFDKNGEKYNYFIMERIATGNYSYQSTDAAGNPITYLDINGVAYAGSNHAQVSTGNTTIYNRRIGDYTPVVRKAWAAIAVQAMNGSVTMALQSRLKSVGGEWAFVRNADGSIITQTQGGFNAEHREIEIAFDQKVSLFDADGYELEFRIVETDASMNRLVSPDPTSEDYYRDGDHFISNSYRFEVCYEGDRIVNRLVGKTDLPIKKTFTPGIEGAESASLYVCVERDAPYEAGETLPTGAGIMPGNANAFILKIEGTPVYDPATGKSTLEHTIRDLERYDALGREYKYTLIEMTGAQYPSMLGDTTYVFSSMSTAVTEADDADWGKRKQISGTLNNSKGGEGESLIFHVTKDWVDEGDLLHREPVEWGLYYKGNKVWPEQGWGLLTANNDWHAEFRLPIHTEGLSPEDAAELRDHSNYSVRENSVGGSTVLRGELKDYYSLGDGDCVLTNGHVYQVIDDIPAKLVKSYGETYGDCLVKNIRVGELKIKVTKDWNLGEITEIDGKPIKASFRISNDHNADTIEFDLDLADCVYESPWLEKYDDRGGIITYRVDEISVNGYPFVNGSAELGDYRITSAMTGETETIGDRHTHDLLERTFGNTRVKTGTVTINKVWHDDGNEGRPDIVLNLWRKDTETGEMKYISIDKIWNTRHNEWYWTCEFGNQPLYNANGYPYEYYVTEIIPQASQYTGKQQYYNGPVQPSASGTDAETTFVPIDGTSTAARAAAWDSAKGAYIGGVEPGTVINTREHYLRIDAYKHWLGKPAWVKDGELPEIEVQLQMTLDVSKGEAGYVPCTLSGDPYNTRGDTARRLNATNKFKFTETRVPYYDAYGRAYEDYRLVEISTNPAYDTTIGSDGNYDITNRYTGNPKIRIGVDKLWDWSALLRAVNGDKYPKLKFELWQSFGADGFASKKSDTLVGTAEIDAGDVASGKSKNMTVYFKNTEDGSELFPSYLWLYGNNGNEKVYYTYWIKEFDENGKALNAYEVSFTPAGSAGSVSGKHVIDDRDVTNKAYIFGAKNTYDDRGHDITANKLWADDSNAYSTRPTDAAPLSYKLWRTKDPTKTKPATEADVDLNACEPVDAAEAWDLTGKNIWVCTFGAKGEETLPEYATDDKQYYYFVTESLNDPYNKVYTQQARTEALSITNALKTAEVYARKVWQFTKNGTTVTLNATSRDDVLYFAGLAPGSSLKLTYRVTAKDAEGNAVNLFSDGTKNTEDCAVTYNDASLLGEKGLRLLSGMRLPQYVIADGEAIEVLYTVEEIRIGNTDILSGKAGCIDVTNDATVQKGNTFTGKATNAFEVMTVKLEKEWSDEHNREGKRPASVSFTLSSNTGKSRAKSITNNKSGTASNDPVKTATYYLPMRDMTGNDLTYTFTETAVNLYKTQVKVNGGSYSDSLISGSLVSDGDTAHFLNSYKPHRINIRASKAWAPASFGYWDILMPDEVTVALERKTEKEADTAWKTVGNAVTLRKDNGWAWPSDTDPWQVDCFREKTSGTQISASDMYVYRVVEVVNGKHYPTGDMGNGLTLSVAGESGNLITGAIDNKTWTEKETYWERDAANGGFKLTNTANKTGLNIEKIWADGKRDRDEPSRNVDFKVYYYRTDDAKGPEDALGNNKAHELTQLAFTLTEGNWTKAITDLPTHDSEGHALYYFAEEQHPYYTVGDRDIDASFPYITSSEYTKGKTSVTNTRKTVDLTVNKQWNDDDNRFKTRKALKFTLYRSKDASAWSELENKTMQVGTLQVKFEGLPALFIDTATGEACAYYYKVVETPQSGSLKNYTTTVAFAPDSAGAVTDDQGAYAYVCGDARQTTKNASLGTAAFTNALKTVTKELDKTWNDQNDKYGTRPTTVTFTAKRHTGACGSGDVCPLGVTVPLSNGKNLIVEMKAGAAGNWHATVADLPKYDENGNEYAYHFIENVLGYDQADDVNDDTIGITNTEKTTDIRVTKNWNDDNDAYEARPKSVWVQLQWSTVKASGYAAVKSIGPVELNADNSWKYTFDDLPIAKAGTQLYYRVQELGIKSGNNYVLPKGYTAKDNGISGTVTAAETSAGIQDTSLTNTMNTTSVKVEKTWDDEEDKYDTRPATLAFALEKSVDNGASWTAVTKNGDAVGITLSGTAWVPATCTGLPTHDKTGAEYKYRAVETVPENYEVTKNGIVFKDGKAAFENTLKTVDIEIEKAWEDENDKYATRPDDLEFAIEQSTDGVNWAPVIADGDPVVVTLVASDGWAKKTCTGLPEVDGEGNPYSYRAVEAVPENYEVTENEIVFNDGKATFENTLKTVGIEIEKTWDDEQNKYGTQPATLAFAIEQSTDGINWAPVKANNKPVVVTLSASDNWTKKTYAGLPEVNEDGDLYSYRAVEAVPENYTVTENGIAFEDGDAAFENKLKTVAIEIEKAWDDEQDKYATRPTDLKFAIERSTDGVKWTPVKANNAPVVVTLTGPDWDAVTYAGLPEVDDDGNPYRYRAVEAVPENYEVTENGIVFRNGKAAFENTLKTVGIEIEKTWADAQNKYDTQPDDLKFAIEQSTDGKTWAPVIANGDPVVITLVASDGWAKKACTGLPEVNGAGKPYRYRAVETVPGNYDVKKNEIVFKDGKAAFENTLKTVDIRIEKTWNDEQNKYDTQPGDLKFAIERSTDGASWAPVIADGDPVVVTLSASDGWAKVTYKGLPEADADGNAYSYRAVEAVPKNYEVAKNEIVFSDGKAAFENTLKTVGIEVEKVWDDEDNRYATRPDDLDFAIEQSTDGVNWVPVKANNKPVIVTLTAPEWDPATYDGLPEADDEGRSYSYRAVEAVPVNYDVAANGITFRDGKASFENALKTVGIEITKTWVDAGNRHGTRPQAIEFELMQSFDGENWMATLANGKPVILTLSGDMTAAQWSLTCAGLPATDNAGRPLSYRTEERTPFGYNAFTEDRLSWSNALQTLDLELTKVWSDLENAYGTRPQSVTVHLQWFTDEDWQDACPIVTLSDDNGWHAVFEDMPMIDVNGRRILYRAVEDDAPGYASVPAEFTTGQAALNNELITTQLKVTKSWQDHNNSKRIRPKSITAKLQRRQNGSWVDVLKNGVPVEVTLTKQDKWTATIDDLPKLDPIDGSEIQYRIVETVPKGYLKIKPVVFVNGVAKLKNEIIEDDPEKVEYELIVDYIYFDGSTAADSHQSTHVEGEYYEVVSPDIPGHTCSMKVVQGTMPDHDLHFIVIYTPAEEGPSSTAHTFIDSMLHDKIPLVGGIGGIAHVGDCFD